MSIVAPSLRHLLFALAVGSALGACSDAPTGGDAAAGTPDGTPDTPRNDPVAHAADAEHSSPASVPTQGGAPAAHTATHWSYEPGEGPADWGLLSEHYGLCTAGQEQSPVDLPAEPPVIESADQLRTSYRPARLRVLHQEHVLDVVDNGHTIQIDYEAGSTVDIGDDAFALVQYHFHAPSEHTIDGRHAPMEMHLVHQDESGAFAVVGVLIEEGEHNAAFDPVWANLPDTPGETVHLEHIEVDIDDMLPGDLSHYRYRGSLTTPPCSEGVRWFVLAQPISLSAQQIASFTAIFDHNYRPVQPIGDRVIAYRSAAASGSSEP